MYTNVHLHVAGAREATIDTVQHIFRRPLSHTNFTQLPHTNFTQLPSCRRKWGGHHRQRGTHPWSSAYRSSGCAPLLPAVM